MPLIASDRSPLPFADEIDYSKFGVRVGEAANASKVLKELVHKFDEQRLTSMRSAMMYAAHMLDYGPNGGLAEAALKRFARVASGAVNAVPRTTKTPMQDLSWL